MNVRLEYQTHFSAGILYEGEYHINHYSITLNMITNTLDVYEQNIAFDRIKFWIHEVVNDSVIIDQSDNLIEAYQQTGQRVIALPDVPFDQIVELMLYVKLSSIVEDRMLITDIKLSSSFGGDIMYLHSDDENVGVFNNDGWWLSSTPCWFIPSKNKKKVVSLSNGISWDNLGLAWEYNNNDTTTDKTSVVFANFTPNESK